MEKIFELAEKHGWLDDFGRWNFKDDGLISFACSMVREHTPEDIQRITKPWVGLTKEEIYDVFNDIVIHENRPDSRYQDFARAIEALLNRKNV